MKLLLILLLLNIIEIYSHYDDPRKESITINKKSNTVQRHTVKYNDGQAQAFCTFQYETNPQTVKKEVKTKILETKPPLNSPVALLETLKGECVKSQVDYWAYEICLGGSVRQYHDPDSYQLGSFARWDGTNQIYSNGAPCEARADRQPRQVTVKFACSSGAPSFLASIRETLICEYEAIVAVPQICDYSQFPVVSGPSQGATQPNGQTEIPVNDGSEEWLLQISKLLDGRFMCSVYSTEIHSSKSELNFEQFGLHISVKSENDAQVVPKSQYIARQPGRSVSKPYELLFEVGSKERFATLANSDKFSGRLAYAAVTT